MYSHPCDLHCNYSHITYIWKTIKHNCYFFFLCLCFKSPNLYISRYNIRKRSRVRSVRRRESVARGTRRSTEHAAHDQHYSHLPPGLAPRGVRRIAYVSRRRCLPAQIRQLVQHVAFENALLSGLLHTIIAP